MREWLPATLLMFGLALFLWISGAAGRLDAGNPNAMAALVNSQDTLTAARFDSFESPRGTDYQVPANTTLYITEVVGRPNDAASTTEIVRIGYGDTAVNNSTAAPTNALVVCAYTLESSDGPALPVGLFCPIPAGKFPFIQPSGAGNYQVTGEER